MGVRAWKRGKEEGSGFSGSEKWLGVRISPHGREEGRRVETKSSRTL